MSEHGYEGATIAQIARAADLAPGLIHYHFESKQEILLALVEHLASLIDTRFESSETHDLDALIDAHLALGRGADRHAVAAWVALGSEALRQPEVGAAYQAIVDRQLSRIAKLVRQAMTGRARKAAAKEIAAGILSAIEGAYRLAVTAPGSVPRGFAAPIVRKMARGAIDGT